MEMRDPSSHPDPETRTFLARLAADGWTIRRGAHWGILYCPFGCCTVTVSGTPRSPRNQIRRISSRVRQCPQQSGSRRPVQ